MGPISRLLSSAFGLARAQNAGLSSEWKQISLRVGLGLPQSLLVVSIQRVGALDTLLRSIEAEVASALPDSEEDMDFVDLQQNLSELWVGSVYEILRVLNERDLASPLNGFSGIFREFTLLRIAIEKYELKNDTKIKTPVRLDRASSSEESVFVEYLSGDPMRAIIMSGGISARGSVMWQAVDWQNASNVWIERQALSDRLIKMLAAPTVKFEPDQDIGGGS